MVQEPNFEDFLLLNLTQLIGARKIADEGIHHVVRTFHPEKNPFDAFEFAWSKMTVLSKSAVLLVCQRDYCHLYKDITINDPPENFSDAQKKILRRTLKNLTIDALGASSVLDMTEAFYDGLVVASSVEPDRVKENTGPDAKPVENIFLRQAAIS